MQSDAHQSSREADGLARFPGLAKLGLADEDLDELGHQGFLALERRQHLAYYKLRFRRAGRQVVRYVGGTKEAALVADELKTLQTARRLRRELDEIGRLGLQMLRNAKLELAPLLLEHGFKFHGRAIRRPRRPLAQ
jgi:hypothetical protein